MKISIVIPTHNRSASLREAMDSVLALRQEAEFEFVIVDNNSTDSTRQVVESYGPVARYVFEGNTSFTMARKAGADNASGDILLYLDDDVLVRSGSLRRIVEIFSSRPDCGVVAGHIDPKYVEPPPAWALDCQKTFNGWSLYNAENIPELHGSFQEVSWAAGPMMAIRRTAYDRVGGFPPDTIGVETNRGERLFNKLYIGPGDYGLCLGIRGAGFRIYYSSDAAVFHVIPPVRSTVAFWRSRVIGEGYCQAITQRGFFRVGAGRAYLARLRWGLLFFRSERKLLARLAAAVPPASGMHAEELYTLYAKAYLDMDYVLRRHPDLWEFLWHIGANGVSSADYDRVMQKLPPEYKALVGNELVYDPTPIDSVAAYERVVRGRGYYQRNLGVLLSNRVPRWLVTCAAEAVRGLRTLRRPPSRAPSSGEEAGA